MQLTQAGSLWGNIYRLRHYKDGIRISDAEFRGLYKFHNLTPEQGTARKRETSSFKIDWIVPDACKNRHR